MDVDPAHMGMDMMYMDMGLMAETTYSYRVAAMNSVGMGEYSDGMAMATTMDENMAPDGAWHADERRWPDGPPVHDMIDRVLGNSPDRRWRQRHHRSYMVQRGYMDADDMIATVDGRGPGPHGHGNHDRTWTWA